MTSTEEATVLLAKAERARVLRTHQQHPDVAALAIERTRDRLDRWGWLFLFAGLAYTTVNVQLFVADAAEPWSLRWITAWLVEPMVMGLMLVLLRGEQIANRYQKISGGWVRATRWSALAITYVMNTGQYWSQGDAKLIFIHSVPVVLVFMTAEALVQQRQTLTEIVAELSTTPSPETPQETAAEMDVDETTTEVPEPPSDDRGASETRLPKGYLKQVAIPAAYRELVAEALAAGRSVDSITLTEIDSRAGTSKYVTRSMIAPLREQLEQEARDGVQV